MRNHVISYNEIDDESQIIAIHSVLEPYDLAYKMNFSLGLDLVRSDFDISFKKNNQKYMVYRNGDGQEESFWLFSNSFTEPKLNKASNLLFEEESVESSLIPEFSKADFMLKRIGEKNSMNRFLKSLSLLKDISSCYIVSSDKIKSKHNLIID